MRGSPAPISNKKHNRIKALEKDLGQALAKLDQVINAINSASRAIDIISLREENIKETLIKKGIITDAELEHNLKEIIDRHSKKIDPANQEKSSGQDNTGDSNSGLPNSEDSGGSSTTGTGS